MNRKCVGVVAILLLVLSTLHAQDARVVADNLEYSREFYSGVHFSAIATSPHSFAYDRYPHGHHWLITLNCERQRRCRFATRWTRLMRGSLLFSPDEEGGSSPDRFVRCACVVIASFPRELAARIFFPFLAGRISLEKDRQFFFRKLAAIHPGISFGDAMTF